MIVSLKKENAFAKVPKRKSRGAAGYDLYAVLDDDYISIPPGEKHKFHTGIAVELPTGYYGSVCSRSGVSWDQDLEIIGSSGTIDDDYRGEIIVPMRNVGSENQKVYNGQRIAQLVIHKYETVTFDEVDTLNETERGSGGFGSTGR